MDRKQYLKEHYLKNKEKILQYKKEIRQYQKSWGGDSRCNNNLLKIDITLFQ